MTNIRFYFIKKLGYCQQPSKKATDSKSNCQNIHWALIACQNSVCGAGKIKRHKMHSAFLEEMSPNSVSMGPAERFQCALYRDKHGRDYVTHSAGYRSITCILMLKTTKP